jgi:hypothetical protein
VDEKRKRILKKDGGLAFGARRLAGADDKRIWIASSAAWHASIMRRSTSHTEPTEYCFGWRRFI